MIRTNLSTRPFYNVRAVRAVIAACAVLVVAITVFNVVQIVRLGASQRTLGAEAQAAEAEAAQLRAQAAQLLARVDVAELETVAAAAREANDIIDRRTFSWTALFTHLETALPQDVRITSLEQQPEQRLLTIGAQARSIEDLDAFIEALESTGAFRDVIPRTELQMEGGYIDAVLQATYRAEGLRRGATP